MMMQKECQMCGRQFDAPDCRRRFCDDCRKARKKMFDADAVKAYRIKAAKHRKEIETQNLELIEQNEQLRQQIKDLSYKCRCLELELSLYK